jgi:hypothetical protein
MDNKSLIIKKYWKFVILFMFLGLMLAQIHNQHNTKLYKASTLIYVGSLSTTKEAQKIPTTDPYLFSLKLLSDDFYSEELLSYCEIGMQSNRLNKVIGKISIHKTSTPLFLEITAIMQSSKKVKECIDYLGSNILNKLTKTHDDYKKILINKKNILDGQISQLKSSINVTNHTMLLLKNYELDNKILERDSTENHISQLTDNAPIYFSVKESDVKQIGPTDSYILILGAVIGLGIGVGISFLHYRIRKFV